MTNNKENATVMETIFIVVSESGKYDDYTHQNEVACLTEAGALAYIEQAKLKHQNRIKDFADFEKVEIERISNLPNIKFAKLIPVPIWDASVNVKDITPEMRAERNEIKEQNKKIYEQYMDEVIVRSKAAKKFRVGFFTAHGYSEDDIIMFLDVVDDVKFSCNELNIFK